MLTEPAQLSSYDRETSLLLTDQEPFLHAAHAESIPFVMYLHEDSQSFHFPYAAYAVTSLIELPMSYLQHVYERFFQIPWQIVQTERCLLREMTPDDVDALYEIYQDKSISRYMEDLYEDRELELEYMQSYIENMYGFYGFGMWMVERLSDGKPLGRAGLNIREGYADPELGYVIRTDEQRKGYGFEICRAIIDYARDELDAKALNAFIHPENTASIRLCTKLGFKHIGSADIAGELLDRCYLAL
ncbi:MAG: GNAT family N-acetyltransferase [Lachnospiraceae bacterium]|nr:GNAT family N-acetyltransferase [Lachnospiraceae bacterium]